MLYGGNISQKYQRRLLLGGVDWNNQTVTQLKNDAVASFSEAWIEIIAKYSHSPTNSVASFSEAWIEILSNKGFTAS